MADCRDWLQTLWSASFKGVPFYAEGTNQEGGRRLAIHEFPFRNQPFVEDLGERAGMFSVSAYVASDLADVEAGAFAAILASDGAGILVLPTHGPTVVRCETYSRRADKDKHGFIAFELRFVREGEAVPFVSAPFLGQLVYAAVEVLVAAAAVSFGASTAVIGYADFVVEETASAVEDVAASIESIRATSTVDPDVSAATRDATTALFDAASTGVDRQAGVDTALAVSMFEATRDLAGGMDPADAATAFAGMVSDFPVEDVPSGVTANQQRLAANRAAVARVARLAALAAFAEAQARRTFKARPEGVTARADVAELFEVELSLATDADTIVAVQRVRNALVEYLSKAITTLAPVVEIEAPLVMPALYWAHRLYGDPSRATELVERNGIKHPSYVPKSFEALAS